MVVGRTETPRSRLGFLTGSAKRARRYLCHEACIQRAECRISICVVTAQVENLCYGMRRGSGTGWQPVLRDAAGFRHRLTTCATGCGQ